MLRFVLILMFALAGLWLIAKARAQPADPDFRAVTITENGAKVGSGFSVRGWVTDERTGARAESKMVIACVGKETKAYWSFDNGSFATGLKVTYRLDLGASKDPFKPLAVQIASDRLAFGLYQNSGLAFLRHLAQALGALEVKIGDATLLFSTVDARVAVESIAAQCGWKL